MPSAIAGSPGCFWVSYADRFMGAVVGPLHKTAEAATMWLLRNPQYVRNTPSLKLVYL